MLVSPDTSRFLAARLLLGIWLACGAGAQAQTLMDTSAAIGVQNTLNQVQPGVRQVPGSMTVQFDACQMAPELCKDGQPIGAAPASPASVPGQPQPAQAAPAPAPAAPTVPAQTGQAAAEQAPAARPAPVVVPLTAEQQQLLLGAQAQFASGRFAQARNEFEALIVRNYSNPEPHFGLGLALYQLGDLRGAAFEFGQFMQFAPQRYEGPYNLGVIAAREGRYPEALRLYGDALALAVSAPPAARETLLQALATEQGRVKDYAALSATYAALRTANPENVEYIYRHAQTLYRAGQYADALPVTYAVLERKPSSLQAALLLADLYVAQGLPDRAVRELSAAAARVLTGTDRAALLLRQSALLQAQKNLRGALNAASEARQEDRRLPAAVVREAELLALLGQRAAAIRAYRDALALTPKSARLHGALAALYLEGNQYQEAAQAAQQALRLTPDTSTQARAQYVRGVVAYRQGQYAQARAALNSSVLAVPDADSLLWLGLSYYALKDYASAVPVLSESVRLRPTPAARQNLAAALLATARYAEAEALLRGLVTDEAKNAEGWYLLGLSQRAQQRPDEARQSFKTAAGLGSSRARDALK
ncbi:tetratricopeptide repeat protein [Deinococcus wulumuqiensis]